MRIVRKKIIGYGLLVVGGVLAPLFPFWGLLLISLTAVWCGAPIGALLFALFLDSFLVPGGVVPFWTSLTLYTALFVPLCAYVRYTTTL